MDCEGVARFSQRSAVSFGKPGRRPEDRLARQRAMGYRGPPTMKTCCVSPEVLTRNRAPQEPSIWPSDGPSFGPVAVLDPRVSEFTATQTSVTGET